MERREAKALGLITYVHGRPCRRRGHVSERQTYDGRCIACRREIQRGEMRHKTSASAVYMREYRARNADKLRHNAYKDKGIPAPTRPRPELCENCNRPSNGRGVLHNDHDHATGKFRGWLCHDCNTGLGKLGDNIEGLYKMIAYLTRVDHTVNTVKPSTEL